MSANPEASGSILQRLVQKLQDRFSAATTEYNEVHHLAQKMEKNAQQLQQRGPVIEGFKQMLMNRYYGVTNVSQLYEKSKEGVKWVWYFWLAPNLEHDVHLSCLDYVKAKLKYPSLENVKKIGATGLGTTSKDLQRVQQAAKNNVILQMQAVGVSVAASASISMLLRRVGLTAKSEFTRVWALKMRGAWQVTGLLAVAYGFARIADAMHDAGPFSQSLRLHRDAFVASQRESMKTMRKSIGDAFKEGLDRGWKT